MIWFLICMGKSWPQNKWNWEKWWIKCKHWVCVCAQYYHGVCVWRRGHKKSPLFSISCNAWWKSCAFPWNDVHFKRFHIFTSRRSLVPISILVSIRLPIVVVFFSVVALQWISVDFIIIFILYDSNRHYQLILFSFNVYWRRHCFSFIIHHQYGSRTTLAHSALNAKSFW